MSEDRSDDVSEDRPSSRILGDWADVSAKSKSGSRAGSVVRRDGVRPRRGLATGVGLLTTVTLVTTVVGVLAINGWRTSPAATAPPGSGGPSALALGPSARASATATPSGIASPTVTRRPGTDVQAGRLVTALDGWALAGGNLVVTHDGGESWAITAPPAPAERIVGAAFADALHGWVVGDQVPAQGASGTLVVDVHRTDDGGATWETVKLAAIPSPGPNPIVGFPTFSVLSANDVVVLLVVAADHGSSSVLYATHDGGRSWRRQSSLIETQSFGFIDPLNGWAIRSDTNVLLRTRDGGRTWARQRLPAVSGIQPIDLFLGSVPVRLPDGRLMLFEAAARDGDPGVFLTSSDGGSSWAVAGRPPAGSMGAVAVVADGTWILGGQPLLMSHDDGASWTSVRSGLPGAIESIAVVDGTHLSAIIPIAACGPTEDCFVPRELWISDDAGTTWRNATP